MSDKHPLDNESNPMPDAEPDASSNDVSNASAEDASPNIQVSMERVEQLLHQGDIVEEHGRMLGSSNLTILLSISDQELTTLAVYKPRQGERSLWDFPDGTLCYREFAAYVVSSALGWDIVAPTVLREGSMGLGAIQFYIEHNPNITYFQLSDDFIPQLQRMAIFDVVVNNTDRKGGHCLLGAQNKLWGIDHGICFHHHFKLRTVIWDFAGQPIPDELITDVEQFATSIETDDSLLVHKLNTLISDIELVALRQRVNRLLKKRTFPIPGAGPNYPWPAV